MKWLSIICLCLLAFAVAAQDVQVVRSRTDQFVVYGARSSFQSAQPVIQSHAVGQGQLFWYSGAARTNEISRIHLVPGLVAVSCERIKEALLHELGQNDGNGKKIHIQLNDRLRENEINILAGQYSRGWLYSMELPVAIDAERFTTAVIEVMLTELANRQSTGEQFEVPLWFLVGFTAHLQAVRFESFALHPNLHLSRNELKVDPAGRLREQFADEVPLTFEEMSWPGNLSSNKAALFQNSAQFLVYELLRMKEGRENLRRFLTELPKYKNWQFAFLAAFKSHFSQLIDVEKWWALQFAALEGRDLTKLLSPEESWEKLKSTLDVPAQIHLKSDRLPVEAKITLQEVIQQWDVARQDFVLGKTINQLRVLRVRVQPEFVPLLDDYRKVLEKYLEQRYPKDKASKSNQPETTYAGRKLTCRHLDNLDERRSKLRKMMTEKKNETSPPQSKAKAESREVKRVKASF